MSWIHFHLTFICVILCCVVSCHDWHGSTHVLAPAGRHACCTLYIFGDEEWGSYVVVILWRWRMWWWLIHIVLLALSYYYMHTCLRHLCMANWFMFTLNPWTHQLYVDILEYHFQVIDSDLLKALHFEVILCSHFKTEFT